MLCAGLRSGSSRRFRSATLPREDFLESTCDTEANQEESAAGRARAIAMTTGAYLVGTPPPFDGIAELLFDDEPSLEKASASPEIEAATADNENFLDEERLQAFVVEEVLISTGD